MCSAQFIYFRINNLGEENQTSVMNTIKTFYKVRTPRKILIVGDFNLSGVSWPIPEGPIISDKI